MHTPTVPVRYACACIYVCIGLVRYAQKVVRERHARACAAAASFAAAAAAAAQCTELVGWNAVGRFGMARTRTITPLNRWSEN